MRALAEPPIPLGAQSGLARATYAIRDAFDAWFVNWADADTIVHPGRVTGEWLVEQGGMAPRIIVSAPRSEGVTLGFGKQVNLNVTFMVFLVLPGIIEDRTLDALNVVGRALNFILANTWNNPADPNCPFAASVQPGTVEHRSLYSRADETRGFSIWLLQWDQLVDNGTAAQTPEPIGNPLTLITIDNRTDPEPDGETLVETRVD